MTGPTRLVTVAHGTRHSTGNDVGTSITRQAAERLGGVPAVAAYVELCEPVVDAVLAEAIGPTLVVPLLLSTGVHVRQDLPRAAARASLPVDITPPIGPDRLLAEVMCLRLRGAGARSGDPVVMVAAGSSDPDSAADLDEAGRLLGLAWGAPVGVATLTGVGRRPLAVVGQARAHGRVVVAPYLLSPGHFERWVSSTAAELDVDVVAGVLGDHPLVAEVVARRFRAWGSMRS